MEKTDVTTETGAKTESTATESEDQSSSRRKAEWTIMVYMAGDNNLADDCVNALVGIKEVSLKLGPTGRDIHIIAQFDPSDTRLRAHRLIIDRDSKPVRGTPFPHADDDPSILVKDRVVIEEGTVKFKPKCKRTALPKFFEDNVDVELDTADPKNLFDLISWSKEKFPAKRYMLILSGHSAGVESGYLLKDENPPNTMELAGLKNVLEQAKKGKLDLKLDVLGMDSCLMSMVEICYELRGLAKILVSSQSLSPNPGWPYGKLLEYLLCLPTKGDVDAEEFAPEIVKRYVSTYVEHAVNSGLSTDLAALNVDASAVVATKVKDLVKAMKDKLDDPPFEQAIIRAHWEAQSYNGELFVDLWDFCDLLVKHYGIAHLNLTCAELKQPDPAVIAQKCAAAEASVADIADKCKKVKDAIKDVMVLDSCFCGIDYQYSNGVSIYFPWSTIFADYSRLAFSKRSGANWLDFLLAYLDKTRRPPRGEERGSEGVGPRNVVIIRRQPPIGHGPELVIHSMRNPPRKWSKKGVMKCIEDYEKWQRHFDNL